MYHRRDDNVAKLGLREMATCFVDHCYGAQAVSLTFLDGFKVSYSGDCRPSALFAKIGQDSTVLIHEATLEDDLAGDALAKKHSTTSEAIGVGIAMRARRLVLTHFSQRYSKIPVLEQFNVDGIKFEEAAVEDETVPMDVDAAGVAHMESENISNDAEENRNPNHPLKSIGHEIWAPLPAAQAPGQMLDKRALTDMKIVAAFDYMSVKVGEISYLQHMTPAINSLFAELEDQKAWERARKAAAYESIRESKTDQSTAKKAGLSRESSKRQAKREEKKQARKEEQRIQALQRGLSEEADLDRDRSTGQEKRDSEVGRAEEATPGELAN